jgi:hopanoid-associated phosphorylase
MGDVAPVIAITGTRREAAVLQKAGVRVIAAGGDAAGLARQLAEVAPGAAGLISFGMAGAIDPSLNLGDWVVGTGVVGGFRADCDPRWISALRARVPAAWLGTVQADGRLVSGVAEKAQAFARSGAQVVDMESHLVAEAAVRAGIPFAILRCVSDTAAASLPPAVSVMMRPDGSMHVGAVVGSVLRQPGQIPALARTLGSFKRAYDELCRGAPLVGDRLGFDGR